MWRLIREYPVRFQAMIQTGIAMGIAFGLEVTPIQLGAIMAFTAAVLAFITERAVTPNSKVPWV